MEKLEIRPLLERNLAKNSLSLLSVLTTEIKGLFAAFSKHTTMTLEQINSDTAFMAKRLNEAIKGDKKFSSLREAEIKYVFQQGMMGALGDKYKNISLMMLFAWFSEYMNHPERRAALTDWVVKNSNDLPDATLGSRAQLTEAEMWEWIEKSYDSYCQQLELQSRNIKTAFLQKDKTPWAGRDVSGLQTKFLVRMGYMKPGEKFSDFLDRTIANEGIWVKVA